MANYQKTKKTTQQKYKQRKTKKKYKKMGIVVPTMNHYLRNG